MEPYQEAYLQLLHSVSRRTELPTDQAAPEDFVAAAREAALSSRRDVEEGTRILREKLFPVLDNILAASKEEIASLTEFAGSLMSGTTQKDVGLHYRIHLALLSAARHREDRDMLIRELYLVGMSLHNLETMLSPNNVRLYTTRMRMCFLEGASYFDTPQYDEITDPETRGYIHRCMGNVALSYVSSDAASSKAKLEALNRSIEVLSDPEVRAKTPSLPWDTFLFKQHQERTTLVSYLRYGNPGPDVFAKVLESSQIVQERQLKTTREKGEPLQPRWQYAYLAARFHCGAMPLTEYLDGLYALSSSRGAEEFDPQSQFSHVSIPALCLEYSKQLPEGHRYRKELAVNLNRMTRRMWAWMVNAPSNENNEGLMFYLRQLLYTYREELCGASFFDCVQNAFAARHPTTYARMWIAGHIARELAFWAVEDCPDQLVGLPVAPTLQEAAWQREKVGDFAMKAGRLYDAGMVHFLNMESSACRGLFEEEEALIQLHAYCGAELLRQHDSTAVFADIALGHHRRYDEKGGFPTDFSLSASPVRAMIALVAVADLLASSAEETASRYRPAISFEEGCAQLRAGEGTRFAPFAVRLLNSPQRREEMQKKLENWKKEAYLDLYRRREEMRRNGESV